MNKQITRVWTFVSASDPNVEYQTLQYADGSTSCDCKGWCRRVSAADGSRSCKHTRWVDLGTADQHCKATHKYETTNQPHTSHAKKHKLEMPRLGHRKFAV